MQNAEPVRDVLRDGGCAPAKLLTLMITGEPVAGKLARRVRAGGRWKRI
jgi:hypothetical protein